MEFPFENANKNGENGKDKLSGRFVVGNPGGPGRPKGSYSSIKDEIKKYFQENPDKRRDFIEHLIEEKKDLTWQMLEGRPSQQVDLGVDKEGISELTKFFREVGNKHNDGTGSKPEGV